LRTVRRYSKDQRIEVDHIKPLSKHWDLRLRKDNLQVLCRDCNRGKGNRHFDDFRTG
jgi:5-methylcytosine-specific restriction endonuclease McrA